MTTAAAIATLDRIATLDARIATLQAMIADTEAEWQLGTVDYIFYHEDVSLARRAIAKHQMEIEILQESLDAAA